MKKNILLLFSLICTIIVISSCSKTETYADMLKKERRAIEFIKDSLDMEIINKMPERGYKFGENEFYKDANTGVYIHVIDWGKEEVADSTTVFLRSRANNLFLVSKIDYAGNLDPRAYIETVYYKTLDPNLYIQSSDTYASYLLSVGAMLPLKFGVGHEGSVSLIIPFSSGSYLQQSQYEPIFIKEMRYRTDTY